MFRFLAVLTALTIGACHGEDRRAEEEHCIAASAFSADETCGTPDEVVRLDGPNFLCVPATERCHIENVRGPYPRPGEAGKKLCCYSYTTVYPDDGSYVN